MENIEIPDSLIRAYSEAVYKIVWPDSIQTLRCGETSRSNGTTARKFENLAIVTACNPYSGALSDNENSERMRALRDSIIQANLDYLDARGEDPEGNWPAEPSYAVLDPSDVQLDTWMEEFGQNAVLVARLGSVVSMRFHPRYTPESYGKR